MADESNDEQQVEASEIEASEAEAGEIEASEAEAGEIEASEAEAVGDQRAPYVHDPEFHGRDFRVEGNDIRDYVGVDPEYMTYAGVADQPILTDTERLRFTDQYDHLIGNYDEALANEGKPLVEDGDVHSVESDDMEADEGSTPDANEARTTESINKVGESDALAPLS